VAKFLETNERLKMMQEEIGNLNRPVKSKETESVIKNLPTMKSPEIDGFMDELYQVFKKKLTSILKLFQNIKEEGTHSVRSTRHTH